MALLVAIAWLFLSESPTMSHQATMSRKRIILVAGAALALATLAVTVWQFTSAPQLQRFVLPDGSVLTLHGVTYGREHRLAVGGQAWQRALGPYLPETLARRLNVSVARRITTNDALVVWLEQERVTGQIIMFGHNMLIVGDEEGTEFSQIGATYLSTISTNAIYGFLFPIMPSTSGKLSIRVPITDFFSRVNHSAEFLVDNPAPQKPAKWQTAAFPVAASTEGVQIILTGLYPFDRTAPVGPGSMSERWMRATYRFKETGKPSTNWQVCSVEVFDESGGSYRPTAFSRRPDMTEGHLDFKVGLSAKSVWKLRFALCRVDGFATNELWDARGIPLEGLERSNFVPMSNSFPDVTLTLYDVASGRPRRLETYLIPPVEDYGAVLVKATDNHEQRIDGWKAAPQPIIYPGGRGRFSFTLQPATNSYSADLTFGVARMRYVEMLVRPNAATNSPSPFPASGK
jgi:hypothetical protein